jgi:3-methyladenine DNA glycosylase/8-oxoguanine DNA glycosylase
VLSEEGGQLDESLRTLPVSPPFDLARIAAPVWWARGRWPSTDWRRGTLWWVGWEHGRATWRAIRQENARTLVVTGPAHRDFDARWASRVAGTDVRMPEFNDPAIASLAMRHPGLRPWAAGSLFEGVISSIVGQSISVAAAAITERRLFALFNPPLHLDGRDFWPPPLPAQLASTTPQRVRVSGVTMRRAEALVDIGAKFASGAILDVDGVGFDAAVESDKLLAIPGIGPWTVRSSLLWGIADADAHPAGDVALLRAVRKQYQHVAHLKDVDHLSQRWAPHRAWAARLLWLDLLGFDGEGDDVQDQEFP